MGHAKGGRVGRVESRASNSVEGVVVRAWRSVGGRVACVAEQVWLMVRVLVPQLPELSSAGEHSWESRGVVMLSRLGWKVWLRAQFTVAGTPLRATAVQFGMNAGAEENGREAGATRTR